MNNNNKTNANRVRVVAPVSVSSATPQAVYDIPFSSIIRAWIVCERNKRSSNSCTKFRWHACRDLKLLWEQICQGKYEPNASMVFMVTYPVLREVWAAAFRDRVMHHWEALRFGPILEDFFLEAGDASMNCRKGYGPLRAVRTVGKMIYDFTEGYTRQDCLIVGGDFANFFMSIDKDILWVALQQLVGEQYSGSDKAALMYAMSKTLYHRPQDKYFRKSSEKLWNGLPARKSLFHMNGLAIGNLPSQLWANLMGAIFTMWIMQVKGYANFVIFVDDFRVLVRSREEGRKLIEDIREYLAEQLHITLHPDKVYLQHYTKGTKMVGAVIKPNRSYIANRTRGRFISAMRKFKAMWEATDELRCEAMLEKLRATINSYLGLMSHYSSYKLRRRICEEYILPTWSQYIYFADGFSKCIIKARYNKLYMLRRKLKNHNFAVKFLRPGRSE